MTTRAGTWLSRNIAWTYVAAYFIIVVSSILSNAAAFLMFAHGSFSASTNRLLLLDTLATLDRGLALFLLLNTNAMGYLPIELARAQGDDDMLEWLQDTVSRLRKPNECDKDLATRLRKRLRQRSSHVKERAHLHTTV
eukprot:TRINITY_DN2536_c0_g1_i2.p1 TRINITY_DN2536_c0_g1~~TRINITY_DN2536_c0_g1_i2.p1  ORF type:complete len:138 (+),score=22.11 TRINITY_DN2536_c0_g1_i2:175-588(+)